MTDCSSCGRTLGRNEVCPHCGAALAPRLPLRWLRYGALTLAVVGLAILLLVARDSPVPQYAVADLGPTMNFGYVRVAGTVSRQPVLSDGSLSFWLNDGTGELYAAAYRDQAEAMAASGMVPHLGDQVQLDGTLRLSEDFAALTINLNQSVVITRPMAVMAEIGALSPDWAGRSVRVAGLVRRVHQPYPGLTLVELRDPTGVVQVAITDDALQLTGELEPEVLLPGSSLEVEGVVTVYRGEHQLALTDAADARILPAPVEYAFSRPVAQINRRHVGQFARLSGAVAAVTPFSAGVKLALDDGTGIITVVLWQDLAAQIEGENLQVGRLAEVVGEIADYRGELEIIPEYETDVRVTGGPEPPAPAQSPAIVTRPTVAVVPLPTQAAGGPDGITTTLPAPTMTPTPSCTATPVPVARLGQITSADVGRVRTIQGQVVEAASFSAGFKFTLDDGSGRIVLLLWSDLYPRVAQWEDLRPGAVVRAVGLVTEYEGELQLEPEPAGVTVLQPGHGPAVQQVATGDLAQREGQHVVVTGGVVSWETFAEENVRLVLDDGSGVASVILWRNVLALVPAGVLEAGARIQVIGQVEEYHSAAQLVPALPVYLQRLGD